LGYIGRTVSSSVDTNILRSSGISFTMIDIPSNTTTYFDIVNTTIYLNWIDYLLVAFNNESASVYCKCLLTSTQMFENHVAGQNVETVDLTAYGGTGELQIQLKNTDGGAPRYIKDFYLIALRG